MKRRLKQFLDSWNFTPAERTVVLTLAGAFILGLAIRMFSGNAVPAPGFDYSAFDAEFAAKSATGPGTAAGPGSDPAPRAGQARADAPGARKNAAASLPDARENVATSSPGATLRIELNRASKRELMRLPGIGEVIAGRIIRYREEHGAFARVDELLKVDGIGAKKFGKISPHCYVEN